MSAFDPQVIDAVGEKKEVTLSTLGRSTGKPHTVTIWIVTDGHRVFIRSGQGLGRHWPQNLLAHHKATVLIGNDEMHVAPRLVSDSSEARSVSRLYAKKYGSSVQPSDDSEPLTPGERASFELMPIPR